MLKSKKAQIISWILFVCCFAGTCVFVAQNVEHFINSDMASDMLLAELLAEEGTLLSKNWYYSTELFVVHAYLLLVPLMYVFTDWYLLRVVASILWFVVMLASAYYVCRQAKMKHVFPVVGILCMLPLSQPYFDNVLIGIHYIAYLSGSFTLFGLSLQYVHTSAKGRRMFISVLGIALAFALGIGGMRLMLTFGLPAVCTAVVLLIRHSKQEKLTKDSSATRFALINIIFFAAMLLGCLLNTAVLSKIYTYRTYDNLNFIEFEFPWTVFNDLIAFWGYRAGAAFSSVLVHNGVAGAMIVLVVLAIRRCWKEEVPFEQQVLSVFYPVGLGIFLLLFCCTTSPYFHTYHLPISLFGFFVLASLTDVKWKWNWWQKLLGWLLIAAVICCGALAYLEQSRIDETEELRDVVEYLKEDGYEAGYGTFWDGNVLAELSDGQFEMYVILGEDVADIDHTYKWLQRKSHDNVRPEGKVFIIIQGYKLGVYAISDMLSPADMVYEGEQYLVYGYDDYETMKESMAAALEESQYY